ncbi:hypothetical protein [Bradyrhizobium sp. STM 3557]|uniref:hypothetical protein n=1 Tax=Bradyrhizobium sp. STM 3557 TaxID=578920 RepID=UPI00388DB5AB
MEFDSELTHDQWETLKALRGPARERRPLNRFFLDQLIALGLAAIVDGTPCMTDAGRKVLVRGSSRLLDLAA